MSRDESKSIRHPSDDAHRSVDSRLSVICFLFLCFSLSLSLLTARVIAKNKQLLCYVQYNEWNTRRRKNENKKYFKLMSARQKKKNYLYGYKYSSSSTASSIYAVVRVSHAAAAFATMNSLNLSSARYRCEMEFLTDLSISAYVSV